MRVHLLLLLLFLTLLSVTWVGAQNFDCVPTSSASDTLTADITDTFDNDADMYSVKSPDNLLGMAIVDGALDGAEPMRQMPTTPSVFRVANADTPALQFYIQQTDATGPLNYPLTVIVRTYSGLFLADDTSTRDITFNVDEGCDGRAYLYNLPVNVLPDVGFDGRYTLSVEVIDTSGTQLGYRMAHIGHGPYIFDEPIDMPSTTGFALTAANYPLLDASINEYIVRAWVENTLSTPNLRYLDLTITSEQANQVQVDLPRRGLVSEIVLGPREAVMIDVPVIRTGNQGTVRLRLLVQDLIRPDIRLEDTIEVTLE